MQIYGTTNLFRKLELKLVLGGMRPYSQKHKTMSLCAGVAAGLEYFLANSSICLVFYIFLHAYSISPQTDSSFKSELFIKHMQQGSDSTDSRAFTPQGN